MVGYLQSTKSVILYQTSCDLYHMKPNLDKLIFVTFLETTNFVLESANLRIKNQINAVFFKKLPLSQGESPFHRCIIRQSCRLKSFAVGHFRPLQWPPDAMGFEYHGILCRTDFHFDETLEKRRRVAVESCAEPFRTKGVAVVLFRACSDFGLRTANFLLKCVKIFAVAPGYSCKFCLL